MTACNTHRDSSEVALRKAAFNKYFKRFRPITLPLRLRINVDLDNSHEGKFPGIVKFPGDSLFLDSVFRKLDQFGQVACYGLLPDTEECVHLIWLSPVGPGYAPSLETFSKTGEVLSEDWIGVRGCGPDPCFRCSSTIVINIDYTAYCADTNVYEPCDDYNNPIPGKDSIMVLFKTGKIPHNGKPEFTGVVEKKVQ